MNIIFYGSASFAVPSLKVLIDHGYKVVAVVTAADKYGGRGKKQLLSTPIKRFAEERNIRILQPKNLKSKKFIEQLQMLEPDLQIVVAFRMLPEVVWAMPKMGTFNLHASLLPKYRGAAPINWAIICGEVETGCTTFFIDRKIDTGKLIMQSKVSIGPDETSGELHDRLMENGASLVLNTVRAIQSDKVEPIVQDESMVTKAPKIYHETCEIDFNQDTKSVHNFIRGMSPYPAAWTHFEGKELKILRARPKNIKLHNCSAGSTMITRNEWLYFTIDGAIELIEIKPTGKKTMSAKDFINGYRN